MIAHKNRSAAGGSEPPAYAVPPSTRTLTSQQVAAIRDVMHLFVEDDLERGIPPSVSEYCLACDAPQPLPGFVRYDDVALCNACATEYEIARTRGLVQDAAAYIDVQTTRTAPFSSRTSGGRA